MLIDFCVVLCGEAQAQSAKKLGNPIIEKLGNPILDGTTNTGSTGSEVTAPDRTVVLKVSDDYERFQLSLAVTKTDPPQNVSLDIENTGEGRVSFFTAKTDGDAVSTLTWDTSASGDFPPSLWMQGDALSSEKGDIILRFTANRRKVMSKVTVPKVEFRIRTTTESTDDIIPAKRTEDGNTKRRWVKCLLVVEKLGFVSSILLQGNGKVRLKDGDSEPAATEQGSEDLTLDFSSVTEKTVWIAGEDASASEGSDVITVELDGKTTISKKLTIIEGVRLSFEGPFFSPVDARSEGWRPSVAYGTATAAEEGQDVQDWSSRISFQRNDQTAGIGYRAWTPAPDVSITKVESLKPAFELKDDPLKGAKVFCRSAVFEHGRPGGDEHIYAPHFELAANAGQNQKKYAFFDITVFTDNTKIRAATGSPTLTRASARAYILGTTRDASNDQIMDWYLRDLLLDQMIASHAFTADWDNTKFVTHEASDVRDSVGAECLVLQEKIKISFKLSEYIIWDLAGKITEGEITNQ